MQKGYGRNEYHEHSKEDRTIVTQLGKTTFNVTRVKGKIEWQNFLPIVQPCGVGRKRTYQ